MDVTILGDFIAQSTPRRGELSSFGAQAEGKVVKRGSVTLQGNSGSGWTTLASDTYIVRKRTGYIDQRNIDDTDTDVEWQDYFNYQDAGNQAFRVTYTVKNGATLTTYTNEALSFDEIDPYEPYSDDGMIDGEGIQNLFVEEIHAEIGDIGGWLLSSTQLTSDSGNVFLDSSVPSIGVGATGYQTGSGFWVGKHSGSYKLYIGDATNKQMYWDGSALTAGGWTIGASTLVGGNATLHSSGYLLLGTSNDIARMDASDATYRLWIGNATAASAPFRVTKGGALTATGVTVTGTITATAGAIGGFDIGSDYVRDAANSFGLASTVTGGDDVRFWAGDTFANRATAPLQLYESGLIFAKDIILAKGALTGASGVTGYGYAVGDPLFLCHYDGARPFETDYTGSVIGHKGQVGTFTWGGTVGRGAFREGKFNKAISIGEGTQTNLITNPSFETNTTGWIFNANGGNSTTTRDTAFGYYGSASLKTTVGSDTDVTHQVLYATTLTGSTTYTVSVWVYATSGQTFSLQARTSTGALYTSTTATATGNWQRVALTFTTNSGGTAYIYFGIAVQSQVFWIDAVQIEQDAYVTPYIDGSLGDGHAWTGTAHASTSTRTAALLTYPASGNINLTQGTLSFWYYAQASIKASAYAFTARIDGNNYLTVDLGGAGAVNKPIALSASGGSSVSTSSGATTVSSNAWHHVVVTWTTGSLKVYVDGVASGATATYVVPVGTLSTFEVGTFNSVNQANTLIDDVCILGHVLTLNEIKSIYYSSAPLMLGVSNQELRLSGAGLGDVFGNANGLFGRASDGTPSFGILNGTVNANTWGGDSESFDSGDFLFGSNKSGKSNLFWDASTGSLFFRVQTTKRIALETDGDVYIGTNITAAATTALAVFGAAQTYNSESVDVGDILIGDNSASRANIFWDKSAGGLYLRVATTKRIGLESDGDVLIGTNITSPTTTYFALFGSNQTYGSGSESVTAGTLMFGDNGADDSNVLISSGELSLRYGTTPIFSAVDLGIQMGAAVGYKQSVVTVGSGNIDLDDDGDDYTGFLRTHYIYISSSTGAFSIMGLPQPEGIEAQRVIIHNGTSNNMTIVDNSGATSYTKIRTQTGADASTSGNGIAELIYNDDSDQWTLLSIRG